MPGGLRISDISFQPQSSRKQKFMHLNRRDPHKGNSQVATTPTVDSKKE